MSILKSIREASTLGEILTMAGHERPIVFYAEDSFSFIQFEGYIKALLATTALPILYVTSDPADPLLQNAPDRLTAKYIRSQLPRLMGALAGSVVVMTMPDLGRFHVPKPPASSITIYLFHSLNSAHTAYRDGAFDFYDVFACTGPHHVKELSALRRFRGMGTPQTHPVGYYKLDRISRDYAEWIQAKSTVPEVLLAPSWGRGNLLEAHGEEVIAALLGEGLTVTVRPHPQFFHSLYPEGKTVIQRLQKAFGSNQMVNFELSIATEDSFHRSSLMISDWSGAAFEYALGTLRPVAFIETPPKIFNPDWEKLGIPGFEIEMRERVGSILARKDANQVGVMATTLIQHQGEHREALKELRSEVVFNPGTSSEAGARLIEELVSRL